MSQQEMVRLPPAKDIIIEAQPVALKRRRRIKWGHICGYWFLLVLLYILATSKRVPDEEVQAMVEHTQMLMGIALFPAIVRGYYRAFFRD